MKRLCSIAALAAGLLAAPLAGAAPKELGFNVHQSTDVGLDAARDAGLGWVRVDFNWLDAEPSQQGVYDWSRFDAIVAAAEARSLKILAVVGYSPAWASQANLKGDGSTNDVPKAGTFAPFVTAVVNRYKAKITTWEIWNEPNLEQFFEGTPEEYIDRVLVPGADAVHAACPACKTMGPGLATVGDKYATWLDAVLTSPAGAKLDIISGHIYHGFPTPGGGAGVTSDSFFNKLESHRVVKIGSATIYEGPLSFKEVMDKHGVTKPFWLTETGLEASLGNATEEEKQRVFYRQVLEVMQSRPWWTGTIFYEAFDEPPAPYRWGAVVHDPAAPGGYRAKSVLGFLKKVTSSQPVYGGTKTDCDDGLDNDLDGTIDFPDDKTCTAASSASEGVAPAPDGGTVTTGADDAGAGGGSGGGADGDGGASGGSAAGSESGADDGGCRAGSSRRTPAWPAAVSATLGFGLLLLARRLTRGRRRGPGR